VLRSQRVAVGDGQFDFAVTAYRMFSFSALFAGDANTSVFIARDQCFPLVFLVRVSDKLKYFDVGGFAALHVMILLYLHFCRVATAVFS
jgi:hypothetical protein